MLRQSSSHSDHMHNKFDDAEDENLDDNTAQTQLMVETLMKEWQSQYCTYDDFRIIAATFNVNNKMPTVIADVHDWLAARLSKEFQKPDLIAVGFQELDTNPQLYVWDSTPRENEWTKLCTDALHPLGDYKLLARTRLVGMMLVVYVAAAYLPTSKKLSRFKIQLCATSAIGTGTFGGNKGAVGVSLRINDTSLCIINSHLSAGGGREDLTRRNSDYAMIVDGLRFSSLQERRSVADHDCVLWVGDLNYRFSALKWTNDDTFVYTNRIENLIVKALAKELHYQKLFDSDELKQMQLRKRAFTNYCEAPITFPPTYKYDSGIGGSWDSSEKARVPAYCDRILWLCNDANMKYFSYESNMNISFSDHKPVRATLQLQVKSVIEKSKEAFYAKAWREADKRMNETLPTVELSGNDIDFGCVKFNEPIVRTLSIRNIGIYPCEFKFVRRPGRPKAHPDWLSIQPGQGSRVQLNAGQELRLDFIIDVKHEHPTASLTQQATDSTTTPFDDLLVLHLVKGRDHFIALSGQFRNSTFGLPLNQIIEFERNKYGGGGDGGGHDKSDDCLLIDLSDDNATTSSSAQRSNKIAMPPKDGIPRHLWLLIERCRVVGFEQTALADDAHEFAILRDYLDAYLPPEEIPKLALSSYVNCVKKFVEAIVDGVITKEHSQVCLHSHHHSITECISHFDAAHRATFIYIIHFLRDLVAHSHTNDMNPTTASGVFAHAMFAQKFAKENDPNRRRSETFIQRAINSTEF